MENKSAQIVIDRTVAMIIAILVIALVAGIFIALNPNFLYKLIPDLAPSGDVGDEVIQGADVLTATCNDPNSDIVGFVLSVGNARREGTIAIGSKGEAITPFLYRKNKDGTAKIVVDDSTLFSWKDTVFGTVSNGLVKIDPQYLDKSNSFFKDLPYLGPQTIVSYFSALNGASFEGHAYFCKLNLTKLKERDQKLVEEEIIALAQMMQGEEGILGEEAMRAAGSVAINRWQYVQQHSDFGVSQRASLLEVISAKSQFYGYKSSNPYQGIPYLLAQELHSEIPLKYVGYYYFGNNVSSLNVHAKMVACASKNSSFKWVQIGTTNLYLSNGYYNSEACTIPVGAVPIVDTDSCDIDRITLSTPIKVGKSYTAGIYFKNSGTCSKAFQLRVIVGGVEGKYALTDIDRSSDNILFPHYGFESFSKIDTAGTYTLEFSLYDSSGNVLARKSADNQLVVE